MVKDIQDILSKLLQLKQRQDEMAGQIIDITACNSAMRSELLEAVKKLNCTMAEVEELKASNAALTTAYNKAIEVINDLSVRFTALEANYDPTVIK